MQHTEGRLPGVGGLALYYQAWRPESEPRAVVALVHGVGEHSSRYMNVVEPLVEDGYVVYGMDQRGHGLSPGRRVHIDRWAEYREDLRAYLSLIAGQNPGRPIVVYGHSMGSLVVLDYLLQCPEGLAGAIISGAALRPAGVASPTMITTARVLTRVLPRMSISLGIDAAALTRDPEALRAYAADPLVTGRATVRWGTETLDTVDRITQGMNGIDIPLLVLHGGADRLNLPEGAQMLFDAIPVADKTMHVYPGVFHEPHNDLGHEQLAADVKAWLASHTG